MDTDARTRRRRAPAIVVTLIGVLLATVPHVWSISRAGGSEPVFPSTMASYSWWTTPLSGSDMDAAVVVYQNGIGVEFMDSPQALILGADGSTYRRLGVAEELAVAADQGDPAESVLSADGTFVVVGSAGEGKGGVVVVTLSDNSRRSLPIGGDRAAVPVGIAADGRSVLLLASDGEMSPYTDLYFRMHGALVSLDLESGAVEEYPELTDVSSAALSPDGTTIAADTPGGIVLVDTALGTPGRLRSVEVSTSRTPAIDGDAWSPDGRRFAFVSHGDSDSELHVVDATLDEPSHHTVALEGVVSGTAIGWRDDETVLLHSYRDFDDNRSFFSWVDVGSGSAGSGSAGSSNVGSGSADSFSSYTPNFTGASLASADVARDLVPVMRVADRSFDRGPLPVAVNLALALALGLVVWALSPRVRAGAGARVRVDSAGDDGTVES